MNNKKLKAIMLVCCLLFAAVLGSCGKAPAADAAEKPANQATPAETAQAESGTSEPEKSLKEEALAAYQQILKDAPALEGEHEELADASFGYDQNLELFGNHYDLFALCDINRDDIPELIALSTVNFRWTPVSVYTYAGGEAVLLEDPWEPTPHGTFEQYSGANGAYITYLCEEGHIHSVWRGANPMGDAEEENHAYALEGTTLTAVDCAAGENENTVFFYDIALANTTANVDETLK